MLKNILTVLRIIEGKNWKKGCSHNFTCSISQGSIRAAVSVYRSCGPHSTHAQTEKYFRNLIKSNQNQIVFTIFRLIWNQTDFRLVPNQSENSKYSRISLWFNEISERFFCVSPYTGRELKHSCFFVKFH